MTKYRYNLVLLLFILLGTSCNKDKANDIVEELTDPNTLTFKIDGYSDFDLQSSSKINDNQTISETKIIDKGDYSVEASFNEVNDNLGVKEKIKNSSTNKQAATSLNQASLYRLVVYESSTKKLIEDKLVKADTTGKVKVSRNVDYDWVAYTYNETGNIPSAVTTNASKIITSFKHTASQNKPFMVAKGTSKIIEDNSTGIKQQTVGILFKQKTARIRTKVDISKVKSNAFLVSGTIIPQQAKTYYGVFDFLNGTEGAYQSHTAYTQDHILTVPAGQDLQTAYSDYQYTSKTDALENYTLKLTTEWRYKVPAGTSQPSNASINNIDTNPNANEFNYTINSNLQYAKNYEFTLKVSLSDYVDFNGIFWARFNLRYVPSTDTYILRDSHVFPSGSYELRDTSTTNPISMSGRGGYPGNSNPARFKTTTNRIDYFRPGYYNISNDNTAASATKDPCSKVGDGKWRLPTKTDYENLVANSSNQRLGLYENIYIVKTNSANNIKNDRINLFRYGRLNYNGNSSNPIWTPFRVGYNYEFYYNSQVDDGAGYYLYKNGTSFGAFFTGFHTHLSGDPYPHNAYIDNIDSGANSAYSVRCVRDVKYTSSPDITIDPF